MNILLDTHTFIWFVEGTSELSSVARNIIESSENQSFISVASLWEMSIKVGLGKLELARSFESIHEDIEQNGFQTLPLEFPHLMVNTQMPWIHRDPFDRILIAQSISERMNLISRDDILDRYFEPYPVKRIW